MPSELRILFVDDEPSNIEFEQHELERSGVAFTAHTAVSESQVRQELLEFDPDIVLCDYTMAGFSGLRALETIRALRSATPVVMISGAIIEDVVIECLECGATDYLLKSNLRRLGPAVRRAVTDARRQVEFQNRIEQLAHYDTLTGLPNLAMIDQMVGRAIQRTRDDAAPMALVILNLDRFRLVDEGFGRKIADAALKEISGVLVGEARGDESVARIGSDEFMLVLAGFDDVKQVTRRVQRILEAIAKPRTWTGRQLNITASAGIALFPSHGADFDSLMSNATAALHVAKMASPGSVQIHSEDITRRAQQRWRLEQDLRYALEHDELSLLFQPQFEIGTGNLCGMEALARWFRADGEAIAPSLFVALAEQRGMIEALGNWALRAGCATAAGWPTPSMPAPICINVSALQICERFTFEIAAALQASGLPPEQLELEITESVLVENPDITLRTLAQWKTLGVRIAVDDFGTGYCGLSYLSKLPIDRLKIDRSFVQGISEDSKESTIVRAFISLGKELGFAVLAEGVETQEQQRILKEMGCQQSQGYLLGRPLRAADAYSLMQRQCVQRRLTRDMVAHRGIARGVEAHTSL